MHYDAYAKSYLYRFILSYFGCGHIRLDADDFNDAITEFHAEDYYYIKDEDDEDMVVSESDIPVGYGRWDGHDLPELAGSLYTFSWVDIFEDPIKHKALLQEIESNVFPLRKEYKEVIKILQTMKLRKKNSYEEFLSDFE